VVLARSVVAVHSRVNRLIAAFVFIITSSFCATKLAMFLKTVGMYCGCVVLIGSLA
jgi:hypothetical protein